MYTPYCTFPSISDMDRLLATWSFIHLSDTVSDLMKGFKPACTLHITRLSCCRYPPHLLEQNTRCFKAQSCSHFKFKYLGMLNIFTLLPSFRAYLKFRDRKEQQRITSIFTFGEKRTTVSAQRQITSLSPCYCPASARGGAPDDDEYCELLYSLSSSEESSDRSVKPKQINFVHRKPRNASLKLLLKCTKSLGWTYSKLMNLYTT